MEKELKIWHALVATLGLLITIISAVVVFSNKVESHEIEIQHLQSDTRDHGLMMKSLNQDQTAQYKEINSKLTDILIKLESKENKK